jgi:TRAP-type mannitol/chloroaromatic compound transport system permease small subunit
VEATIRFIDHFSARVGKAFAWCIVIMTFGMGWEVFSRYLFNAPTGWSYDLSYMMYGTLFMMGGAYTLSHNAHVRGDFLYRLWRPRTQALVELILYLIFFMPAMLALTFSGWKYASRSLRYREVSVMSPADVPIFQFKLILVAAGALMLFQGIGQILRCIHCLRTGQWFTAEEDVIELEEALIKEHAAHDSEAATGGTGGSDRS